MKLATQSRLIVDKLETDGNNYLVSLIPRYPTPENLNMFMYIIFYFTYFCFGKSSSGSDLEPGKKEITLGVITKIASAI
jgi:hypothetical protein